MRYTKIERVEFLLEEIKEILRKDTPDASQVVSLDLDRRSENVEDHTRADCGASISSEGSVVASQWATESPWDSSDNLDGDAREICVRCFISWESLVKRGILDLPRYNFELSKRARSQEVPILLLSAKRVRKRQYIPKVGQEEYKLIILGTVTSTEAYSKAAGYASASWRAATNRRYEKANKD